MRFRPRDLGTIVPLLDLIKGNELLSPLSEPIQDMNPLVLQMDPSDDLVLRSASIILSSIDLCIWEETCSHRSDGPSNSRLQVVLAAGGCIDYYAVRRTLPSSRAECEAKLTKRLPCAMTACITASTALLGPLYTYCATAGILEGCNTAGGISFRKSRERRSRLGTRLRDDSRTGAETMDKVAGVTMDASGMSLVTTGSAEEY